MNDVPKHASYDVVIVGGAMMGSSAAWFLSDNKDFQGRVLVIEKDPSYSKAATSHTNSCIRQQFSAAINVRISQFAADFLKNLRHYMGDDDRVPALAIQNYGYMYLADTPAMAAMLRASHSVQRAAGAATRLMTPDEIRQAYPFYNVDDIVLGSINRQDEGYWDYAAVFDWWRRSGKERGVETIADEVVAMTLNKAATRVESVTLKSGAVVGCGYVVNASGTRGAVTARMAGLDIPLEPRKRYTYIFAAAQPLADELPLTVDPSGVHFRQDGRQTYLAGAHAEIDPAVDFDDFSMDQSLWQEKVWPVIAARIPQFEAIKVLHEWAGHYDMNTLDHNAILGPHTRVSNFMFLNGFSGHGLQQAPAMGRAIAELVTYGGFRTLDLSPFSYARIERGEAFVETAII
ncbi:MAG: FAD-binding oxidoreductase [Hyphomicrobiales bacterium]|nr:FAD-binding oxidoreductase [Hyphomicrobiales bacterium]